MTAVQTSPAVLPAAPARRGTRPAPPSTARIALARTALELRLFARERQQVVFSFAYPVVMMVIFASVLGGEERPGGIPFAQYFLAGIAATGIMLTSFQAVGTAVAPSGRPAPWSGCRCSGRRRRPTSRARPARCW